MSATLTQTKDTLTVYNITVCRDYSFGQPATPDHTFTIDLHQDNTGLVKETLEHLIREAPEADPETGYFDFGFISYSYEKEDEPGCYNWVTTEGSLVTASPCQED